MGGIEHTPTFEPSFIHESFNIICKNKKYKGPYDNFDKLIFGYFASTSIL